jgi:hypothetical protein
MLDVYVMEVNLEYSKTAVEVSDSISGLSTPISAERGIVVSKAPMGTGNYYCRFNDGSVMYIQELSKVESAKVVSMYFILDNAAFLLSLYICYCSSKAKLRGKLLLCVSLSGVVMLLSLIVNCYCSDVLFGSHSVEIFEAGIRVCFVFASIYLGEDHAPNPFRSM